MESPKGAAAASDEDQNMNHESSASDALIKGSGAPDQFDSGSEEEYVPIDQKPAQIAEPLPVVQED